MEDLIKKQMEKVDKLVVKFEKNPNKQTATKLSNSREDLKNLVIKSRQTPEYKEEKRKAKIKFFREMADNVNTISHLLKKEAQFTR
jgi:hypothetical protein